MVQFWNVKIEIQYHLLNAHLWSQMCLLDRRGGNTPCRNHPKMAIYFAPFHLLFNLLQVACGAEFSMIVDRKGYLYSFGLPEYGQLGHNTDGKFFITSNKLSYQHERVPRRVPIFVERSKDGHPTPVTDVQIVDIACGTNHTVSPILKHICLQFLFIQLSCV